MEPISKDECLKCWYEFSGNLDDFELIINSERAKTLRWAADYVNDRLVSGEESQIEEGLIAVAERLEKANG